MNTINKSKKKKGLGPMDAALNYLGYSARSVREVERFLDSKEFGEVEVYETVERLKDLGLLDDRKFAEEFIASRLRSKPVSRAHLREQLYQHEVNTDVIDEAMEAVTDEMEAENAQKVAEDYAKKLSTLPAADQRERILRRMVTHGFSYGTAKAAVDHAIGDTDEVYE